MDHTNQRIAKNTLFLYIRFAIVMIANLYITRSVLAALGASDFGIYNVVCGFVAMFGLLNTSMTNGIQRFYNYELGKNGDAAVAKVFNTAIIIQMVLAAVLILLAETIGLWYLNAQMVLPTMRIGAANWIFQFAVVSLLFVIFQIPYSAAVLSYERMDFYTIVSIVEIGLKLIVVVALPYLNGDGLIIYGASLMGVTILSFVFYYFYCFRYFPTLRFQRRFDKDQFKTMVSFSGWHMLSTSAYLVKGQGLNVLINAFFGTIVNAANGIASQISSAIQTFSMNLVTAFKPQLTQSYAVGDYRRTEQLMCVMSKMSYILMSILAIPVLVEMDYVLRIWLGDTIPEYTDVFAILTIVAMMIGVLNTPITQVVHSVGNIKLYEIITSVVIFAILPISWIFLKLGFDVESVFFVTIIMMLINQIASLLVLRRVFEFNLGKYVLSVVVPCALITVSALVVSIGIANLMSDSFLRFVIVAIVNLLVVAAVAMLTLNKAERDETKKMILGILRRR